MKVCQFNFNNEVDTFEIHVNEENGSVAIPGDGDQILAEYDSVQQLAEIYAQARDVKPENLKNWVLLENGDVYSFVLRAGTAGVNVSEVEEELEQAFDALAETYHPLNVARAKEQIMADGTKDLTDALVHCTETDIARDIYDAMSAAINGTADDEAVQEEEDVDTRSDLEKYLDEMEAIPCAIGFLATLVGQPIDAEKTVVLEALTESFAFSNVSTLRAVFENAVQDAQQNGIGVDTVGDALTVITQTPAAKKDEAVKNRMVVATRMAGRRAVNVSVDVVGQTHIRHTAEMLSLDQLAGVDLYVRDNVPYIVRFSDTVDAELEAEREAEEAERESVTGAEVRTMMAGYDDDYDDDSEDDDYDAEDEEE